MKQKSVILLQSHFENELKINGEPAWVVREYNASTGYFWRFRPDDSGVYELVEEITAHPSVDAVGVPGVKTWVFQAIREGKGSIMFELYPPGSDVAVETVVFTVHVS